MEEVNKENSCKCIAVHFDDKDESTFKIKAYVDYLVICYEKSIQDWLLPQNNINKFHYTFSIMDVF